MNDSAPDPTAAYYLLRITLGFVSSFAWALLFARSYRSLEREGNYERRLWTALLISFPGIYSIGYALISVYSFAAGSPAPDPFPLIVATLIQVIALVYALRLLRRSPI